MCRTHHTTAGIELDGPYFHRRSASLRRLVAVVRQWFANRFAK